MGVERVRPGPVVAAAAAVLGGDTWLIGLAWGGEDGASMLGLGAALLVSGVLVLAGTWGRQAPTEPVARPKAGPSVGAGAPARGGSAALSRG